MPTLNKLYTLEVTVEQFLDACDPMELQEVELLMGTPRYRSKMNGSRPPKEKKQFIQTRIPD